MTGVSVEHLVNFKTEDNMQKPKRKYNKRNEIVNIQNIRRARCGHISYQGRYFNCEKCVEKLPEEDDFIYCDWQGLDDVENKE